jgi:hypothetical protein
MHSSPKAPSVVLRTCELSPAGRSSVEPLRTSALPRTDSPSVHPCPASGSALGFFPASALSLHEPLRTPGAEDARCVQPTSATRTNDVHPFAVRSRFSRVAFATRDAPQHSEDVTWHDRGNEHFHDARSASASICGPRTRCPRAFFLADFRSRARAYWTRGVRWLRPLTPLSRTRLPLRAHVTFVRALEFLLPVLMVSDATTESEE